MSAREIAHLSLITNLALPLLLWALLRTIDQPRLRRGAVVGLVVAAATYSDAYYGIYCVCMSLILLAWRFLRVECTRSVNAPPAIRLIDVLSLAIATTVIWRLVSGTTGIYIGPVRVGMETLHTPMLALVVLGGLRLWLRWQPVLRVDDGEGRLRALIAPGMVAVFVCLALLSPLLVGIANRYMQGRLPDISTYWRSSPRGVDLLAYVVPNPNHPWFGQWTRRWLLPDTADAFPEFVAGFSLLALIGILVAGWQRKLPGLWVAFTATFVLLSLGPFIHVGGINTFVIGPWALLRYVPIIGMARAPSRFSIVAAMGLSLLFGFALNAWLMSRDKRWTMSLAVLALLIGLEVLPAPRALYAAQVPDIYRWVTAVDDASDQGRLLELPTGIRDGTSSIGDFNASTEFFQTKHGRPLIGGYLSRVSSRRKAESLQMPMLRALYKLSEGGAQTLPEELSTAARQSSETFLARTCVKYVVVDKRRASADLRTFALDALGLVAVQEDERYQLLIPARAPTCAPSSRPLDGS